MKAYTYAETILYIALREIGLAEIGDRSAGICSCELIVDSSVITVIESIDTCTYTEDAEGNPVGCGFEGSDAIEALAVLVVGIVVLLRSACSADLYCPWFIYVFMQFLGGFGFIGYLGITRNVTET